MKQNHVNMLGAGCRMKWEEDGICMDTSISS